MTQGLRSWECGPFSPWACGLDISSLDFVAHFVGHFVDAKRSQQSVRARSIRATRLSSSGPLSRLCCNALPAFERSVAEIRLDEVSDEVRDKVEL